MTSCVGGEQSRKFQILEQISPNGNKMPSYKTQQNLRKESFSQHLLLGSGLAFYGHGTQVKVSSVQEEALVAISKTIELTGTSCQSNWQRTTADN